MGYLYATVAEYDTEIELTRIEMRNAIKARKFRLNTSQSDHMVEMDVAEIRKYLTQLTTERQSLVEKLAGAAVTSIVFRRS